MISSVVVLILIGALSGLVFVFFRKLPEVQVLESKVDHQVAQDEHRVSVIEAQIKRYLLAVFKKIKNYIVILKQGKWLLKLGSIFSKYWKKVVKKQVKKRTLQIEKNETEFDKLWQEAEKLESSKDFVKAEDKFIQLIKLDVNNVQVYQSLVSLYLKMKEYLKAEEVHSYVLQILAKGPKIHQVTALAKMAEIKVLRGKLDQALHSYVKALELDQMNARLLSKAVQAAIWVKDAEVAQDLYQRLERVSTDKANLTRLKSELKELLANKT